VKLLEALKKENYHVVLETSGILQWNEMEPLTKLVDIFYLDIKGIDRELHIRNTGRDNSIILANAENLAEKNVKVVYRIPNETGRS
jgi:pyruvate formate lyase activating enzyme